MKQDSGVAAAENPRSQRSPLKPSEDVSNSSSRLPAPIISRLRGGGGNATGPKRRSMLPQLSPTKGYGAALEAGKREHARTHEGDSKPNNGSILPAPGADGTRDGMKSLPILGSPVRQNRNMGVTSDNAFSEDTQPRQDASTGQLDGPTYPIATESVSSRPRTLPQPRAVSAIAGPGSRPAPLETKEAGGREIIAKSTVPGRPRPPRQPTATSANTSRDTTNWTGLSTASARPRSLILSAGRDFGQETRPASSTSASSSELAPSEKPDPKRQPPTHARHRRTPSTRSERAAFSSKSKELDRRDASGKALASTREASATAEQKKPAFSTLQQHFTPKKALKAPTSFYLATAAGKQSNDELMSPETARLQTELLQLHLLHESSAEVLHSWQGSVEVKLQRRFEDVAQKYRRVAALERETQARLNLCALKEFARDGGAGQGLGERIQSLGSVIPEIVSVTGAGGKYARLVKNFEWWIEWIEQIQETRGRDGSAFNGVGEMEFVDGLGNGWRDETATLSRKLGFWLQNLDGVGSSPAGSSLALVVARCRCLVEGMLQELDIMRGMECAIVVRESCWVSEKVAELLAEIDSGLDKADSAPTTDKESGGKQGIWMSHGKGYVQST
ncbi:MAG: hypothetical protein M1840_000863 [Geoglossum simile]|nr:MAG: hypothetical protein M1840_000863 [Geoglossum simile]